MSTRLNCRCWKTARKGIRTGEPGNSQVSWLRRPVHLSVPDRGLRSAAFPRRGNPGWERKSHHGSWTPVPEAISSHTFLRPLCQHLAARQGAVLEGDRTPKKSHEKKGNDGFPPVTSTRLKGVSSSTTTSHSATHPISHPQTGGCTYIFFNVLGLHSLVGIICRIEGAKYKPGEERQRKKEEMSFSPML